MENEKKENLLMLKMKLYFYRRKYNNECFKLNDSPDRGGYTHADASQERVLYYKGLVEATEAKIAELEQQKSKGK